MKKVQKLLTALTAAALLAVGFGTAASAETLAYPIKVYGDDKSGAAMNQGTWDQFYTSGYYVYFQIDFNVKCTFETSMVNQQVTGDADLKPGANTKIKFNGKTVKQLNDSLGDSYGIMIAYEPNDDKNLRMSVWIGGARGELFNKDLYDTFTVEILEGLKVPGEGYAKGNGKVGNASPAKYKLSIADLEYGKQTSNPNYNQDKADWVKPLFENLKSKWEKVSGANPPGGQTQTPTKPATTATPKTEGPAKTQTPGKTETTTTAASSDTTAATQDTNPTEGPADTTAAPETTAANSSAQPTGGEEGSSNVLPIVLIVIGVLLVGGAVTAFLLLRRRQTPTDNDPQE